MEITKLPFADIAEAPIVEPPIFREIQTIETKKDGKDGKKPEIKEPPKNDLPKPPKEDLDEGEEESRENQDDDDFDDEDIEKHEYDPILDHATPDEKVEAKKWITNTSVKSVLNLAVRGITLIFTETTKISVGEISRYEAQNLLLKGTSAKMEDKNDNDKDRFEKIIKRGTALMEDPLREMFRRRQINISPEWNIGSALLLTGYELSTTVIEVNRENKKLLTEIRDSVEEQRQVMQAMVNQMQENLKAQMMQQTQVQTPQPQTQI
jgi:hypothetical protein